MLVEDVANNESIREQENGWANPSPPPSNECFIGHHVRSKEWKFNQVWKEEKPIQAPNSKGY